MRNFDLIRTIEDCGFTERMELRKFLFDKEHVFTESINVVIVSCKSTEAGKGFKGV